MFGATCLNLYSVLPSVFKIVCSFSRFYQVIPPIEFKPNAAGYEMGNIRLEITNPIEQNLDGDEGVYSQSSVTRKSQSLRTFYDSSNAKVRRTPEHKSYDDLEQIYWRNVNVGVKPWYGADVPGTLFDDNVEIWNLSKLPTILNKIEDDMPGINTPFLYFGMWKTSFGWHVEDMDLYSINYHHFGHPKTWYIVPPAYGYMLEQLADQLYPDFANECTNHMRHKMLLISPIVLKRHNIPFKKITQEAGQFIITFPYAYHSGFNHGFNINEAVNFGMPR